MTDKEIGKEIGSVLLKMKDDIETAKSEKARIEGKLDTYKDKLKEEYGCTSLQQAKIKINEMEKDAEKKQQELIKGVKKLHNEYDWRD